MNLKKVVFLTLCMISLSLIVGCGAKPIEVPANELCNDIYKGKVVVTEGVILVPKSMVTSGRLPLAIRVKDKGKTPIINVAIGTGPNTAERLPLKFTPADLKITAKDGSIIKNGDRVRVTGKMTNTSKSYSNLQVKTIEKL